MHVRKVSGLLLTTNLRICCNGCGMMKVWKYFLYIHSLLTARATHGMLNYSTWQNTMSIIGVLYGYIAMPSQFPVTTSRDAYIHWFFRSSQTSPTYLGTQAINSAKGSKNETLYAYLNSIWQKRHAVLIVSFRNIHVTFYCYDTYISHWYNSFFQISFPPLSVSDFMPGRSDTKICGGHRVRRAQFNIAVQSDLYTSWYNTRLK